MKVSSVGTGVVTVTMTTDITATDNMVLVAMVTVNSAAASVEADSKVEANPGEANPGDVAVEVDVAAEDLTSSTAAVVLEEVREVTEVTTRTRIQRMYVVLCV